MPFADVANEVNHRAAPRDKSPVNELDTDENAAGVFQLASFLRDFDPTPTCCTTQHLEERASLGKYSGAEAATCCALQCTLLAGHIRNSWLAR